MEYLATFHTHFDAIKYLRYVKSLGLKADMKPVPRKLSSSCGSCVILSAGTELDLSELQLDDLDRLYLVSGQDYRLIIDND